MHFVYSVERVDAEYFIAQLPLPEPRNVGYLDPALFGTWYYENDPAWTMDFHENGGGLRGTEGDTHFFSWGIVFDEILSIYAEVTLGRISYESWDFTITDDYLLLRSPRGGRERKYIRR